MRSDRSLYLLPGLASRPSWRHRLAGGTGEPITGPPRISLVYQGPYGPEEERLPRLPYSRTLGRTPAR